MEFDACSEALARVMVEAGDFTPDEHLEVAELRNAPKTIGLWEPDWKRWVQR